jgi:hypothetical protein
MNHSSEPTSDRSAMNEESQFESSEFSLAFENVEKAISELVSERLEMMLEELALKHGKTIARRVLPAFALGVFAVLSAYGVVFQYISITLTSLWPTLQEAKAGLVAHSILLFLAIVFSWLMLKVGISSEAKHAAVELKTQKATP